MKTTLIDPFPPRTLLWAVALTLSFAIQPLLAAQVVWSGADAISNVNTNWSDTNNWSGGTPAPANSILFTNAGAVATQGSVNNIVDGNNTIATLQYANTTDFHTTQINPGITLTVSNTSAVPLVFAGTGADDGPNQTLYASMKGAGAFVVVGTNSGSAFVVQQGTSNSVGSHVATLDLSSLANFSLTAGQLLVAGYALGPTGPSNYLSGTLYLAHTNYIRVNGAAPAIDVGDANANPGLTSYLYLGQTNAIFADSMTVGHSKSTATLTFNPALAGGNPVLYLNGNTNPRVSLLTIGDDSVQSGSGYSFTGTMNLNVGTVNAQVNTCYLGLGQSGAGTGGPTGILGIGAGVFNVNTLYAGYLNSSAATANVYGIVNVSNGTLVVNSNLVLGYNPGATVTAYGTLNITNGTVLANAITGGGTSQITMRGGWLAVSNTLCTLAAPLSSLTVSNGATLQFWVANHQTNAAITKLASDNSGAISIGAMPLVITYPSQYPLIYSPAGGASGVKFALDTLPAGYLGYVSNDNSSTIWLVVTNGPTLPKTDLWSGGVNNNWDTNTLNWTNNGVAVTYVENDFVVFNDSAQTNQINLAGSAPHTPYTWTVTNNVLNYKFTGTNSVAGGASLVKWGSASVTLAESGDTFSNGITVNGGTVVLDEAASAIAGGLTIASGATAQIGNNDTNGSLPAGTVTDNGTLVFNQTLTNFMSSAISGGGSLMQNGSGVLDLTGANGYTGNTVVLRGTLALAGGGAIASSANVIVSNATLDVSATTGGAVLGNLNLTNATINIGATTANVSGLNLGGTSNTLKVVALPPILFYPTNLTLIQAAGAINGYNFVLGGLPAASPSFAGTLGTNGNAVVLTLTAGPISSVAATITFSATNSGLLLNPSFPGLSYEKNTLQGSLFVSNDVSLISMFSQIAPAVLRIGGNSVDTTCWGGLSNLPAITTGDVDALAGFVKALPTNWHVIYGINMSVNNPSNCAAEAAYAANALGSHLLGFEIGNECDLYYENGIRTSGYTFANFLAQWRALAGAITNTVPGWAITNGGNGWTLTGPVSADNTEGYTVPFAGDEAGVISLLSQHYYRANGQSSNSTLEFLLQPDTSIPGTVSNIVSAATAAGLPLGFRMAECGSYYNGGAPNVSDAYGTALWSLDFMFTLALNGAQGLNFHGGGDGTGYTPIADNGTAVVQARPEFYGLKMFSLVCQHGSVIPATLTLASNINFTAYGVRQATGGISALLNNKETNDFVQVSINLGPDVIAAQVYELTAPAIDSTNDYTLGGAEIEPNGSWSGGVQWVIPATNGQLGLLVPPFTAILLNPVVSEGTNLLLANDALNTTSWTGSTNWTDLLAPHAGANYFTGTNLLRTPTTGSVVTFAGDSLTFGPETIGNASMYLKLNPPGGTYIINNCTNAGGVIDAGISNSINYLSGTNWFVAAPSAFGLLNDNARAIVLTNLNLSGSSTLSNGINGSGLGTITYADNATLFTGPMVTSLGTTLLAWSQTNLGGNPPSFNPAQFVLDNGIFQPLASMALTNANSGVTINPGGGTFTVTSNLVLTIANPIAGTGGLTNQGGGVLVFSGTNTYSGATTISAGTLALSGHGSLSNSPNITIAGGATFDVSGLSSAFSLAAGQSLSNNAASTGTLKGSLNTGSGAISVSYANGTPAFTVTNGTLTLAAGTVFKLNNPGSALGAGSYLLIATNTSGLVAGTMPAISVNAGGLAANTHASLAVAGGQLYLVVQNITATSLATSGSPSTYGQPVTFTATVSPAPATVGETITFYDGATAIGSGTNNASGVAVFTTTVLAAGPHSLTAVYPGDASNLGSTNPTALLQAVNSTSLTITANSTNKVYNGVAFSGGNGVTYAGFVNGQTNTVLSGSLVYTGNSQGAIGAGAYTITPAGLTNASGTNYAFNYVSGTLTISQKGLIITASNTNKVYGQTLTLAGFTTSGLTNSDSVGSVTLTSSGTPGTATVGVYPIAATNAVGSGLTNYSLSYVSGTLIVNPLVAALAGTRAYDGTTNVAGAILTVTNTVNSDVVTLSGTGGLASAQVGTNAITSLGSLTLSSGAGTNYTLAGAGGWAIITQASPSVSWTNPAAITYGTPLSSSQLNASASVNGSFAYNPTNGAVLNVGTNTLTAVFTPMDTTDYVGVTNAVSLVVLLPPPVASFAAAPTNGYAPLAVTFTNLSTGAGLTNWLWSFGDGTTSNTFTGSNVIHTYASASNYTVSLVVSGQSGVGSVTVTDAIQVIQCLVTFGTQPPLSQAAVPGDTVTLEANATTSTTQTNYQWYFEGNPIAGATNSSLVLNDLQTTNFGAYFVEVNNGACSENSSNAVLTLANSPLLTAPGISGATLTLSVPTQYGPGCSYIVEYKNDLTDATWTTLTTLDGDGDSHLVADSTITNAPCRYYRIRLQ